MKLLVSILSLGLAISAHAATPETRCGWIENPTPGNYDLYDAAGVWTISVQGGHQAEGDLAYPLDYDEDYVKTNGNYGYFCGCIRSINDATEMKVLKILTASAKKISACLNDRKLPQDYKPRRLVHSMGKAFTECQDDEMPIGFKGRDACVNSAGDYYFLAN